MFAFLPTNNLAYTFGNYNAVTVLEGKVTGWEQ